MTRQFDALPHEQLDKVSNMPYPDKRGAHVSLEPVHQCCWPGCPKPAVELALCSAHTTIVVNHRAKPGRPTRATFTEPPPPRWRQAGVVYYLRLGEYVKIGHTVNFQRRIREYPPHAEVLALEPGTRDDERARHRLFADDLASGNEWFVESDTLKAHIASVIEQHGPPKHMHMPKQRRGRNPVTATRPAD